MDDGDFAWACSLPLATSGGGDNVGAYVVNAGDGAGEPSGYKSSVERRKEGLRILSFSEIGRSSR